jgi:hypothetical protein
MFFSDVKDLLFTKGVKFQPKILGYLADHRWGAPAMLTYN